MSSKNKVPVAWDDDWVIKADESSSTPDSNTAGAVKASKAERRAKQAELNKKLWEEAEAPRNPYFVESRNDIPFGSEFKPAVKVLSRKPAPKVIACKDAVSGLEELTIEDEDDDEEDDMKFKPLTMEERKLKAQKEREEKVKKYDEVRGRLFGNPEVLSTSGPASLGTVTPPNIKANADKVKGKGRGRVETRPPSSTGRQGKQLFDPNYTAKPDSGYVQKVGNQASGSGQSTPNEEQIIRQPRGPNNSGIGGFGFASRDFKGS